MTLKEAIECLTNPNVHEMILPPNQLTEWLQDLELLREKHWDECRQIALYDNDLKKAISLTSETVITALDNLDAKDMIRELSKYLYEAVDGFRFLCDCCGKETKTLYKIPHYELGFSNIKIGNVDKQQLCAECAERLCDFINGFSKCSCGTKEG